MYLFLVFYRHLFGVAFGVAFGNILFTWFIGWLVGFRQRKIYYERYRIKRFFYSFQIVGWNWEENLQFLQKSVGWDGFKTSFIFIKCVYSFCVRLFSTSNYLLHYYVYNGMLILNYRFCLWKLPKHKTKPIFNR